jgi:hypothetical protein
MGARTGAVAQAVECLLCKRKALSSNPTPTKKKKEPAFLHKFGDKEV